MSLGNHSQVNIDRSQRTGVKFGVYNRMATALQASCSPVKTATEVGSPTRFKVDAFTTRAGMKNVKVGKDMAEIAS